MIPEPQNVEETGREAGLAPSQPTGERLRHAARLLMRYWISEDWPFAWSALVVLVAFNFGAVYFAVWMNNWQQQFYDSIQYKAAGLFAKLVTSFLVIILLQLCMSTVSSSLIQWLGIRWREYLTRRYLGRWFANDRYYEIERLQLIDNPDQRIAEDLAALTGGGLVGGASVLDNFLGLLQSLTSAVAFSVVLFSSSQPIHLAAFGYTLDVPGDMVWYGWAYAGLGAVFIVHVGRPFVRRVMRQQHYEGNYRSGLLHIRRDAAQIAFSKAQPSERRGLDQSFAQLRRNFKRLILANLGLNVGQGIYERIGTIVPLFLTVPRYFGGTISFGQVMAAKDAFEQLTTSLSYFVQAYSQIGGQIANVNRLKGLDDALDYERPRGIRVEPGTDEDVALMINALEVRRPHGAPLLHVDNWTVRRGERWMIAGASGAGKSTLLRAVAGLWPDGDGVISIGMSGLAMFVPQRLYLPLGTLKDAICFPHEAEEHSDAVVIALLERVRLRPHVTNIHALRMWHDELSPGEQQRLALARILLHRPDLLVLDEATSALDPDNAQHFHQILLTELPGVTLISVVHDAHLRQFHNRLLQIDDGCAHCLCIEPSA